MSFQEIAAARTPPRTFRPTSHLKIVAQPLQDEENLHRNTQKGKGSMVKSRRHRPLVLHGKVQRLHSQEEEERYDDDSFCSPTGFRQRCQSRYSQLAAETQQFHKLVTEFISLLEQSGETPEAAWKSKILGKSAQETDHELWQKLAEYERSLRIPDGNVDELRTAQAACMKLHRDFKRSHKALVTALSEKERQQRAEISRLAAAGWSEEKEDFFDKTMRERELQQINKATHQVNDIYKELSTLVESQQAKIDELEDNIAYATENVKAASHEYGCLSMKERFLCGAFDTGDGEEWGFLRQMDSGISFGEEKTTDTTPRQRDRGIRVEEDFHWYMPFETIKQDMESVKQDIVGLGEDVLRKAKQR